MEVAKRFLRFFLDKISTTFLHKWLEKLLEIVLNRSCRSSSIVHGDVVKKADVTSEERT